MTHENFQTLALLFVVFVFILWKLFRFKNVKNKLPEMIKRGALIVDVRTPEEFATGNRPGSLNIPLDSLPKRYSELDSMKPIILCCASGVRSGVASNILKKNGFKEVVNAGPWTNTLIN